MPGLVLLGGDGEPLGPSWIHADRRSRPIARKIIAECADEFLNTVGNAPLPGGLSALCYAQQVANDAGLPGRVRQYLHLNGWLGLLLTGRAVFEKANASFTGLFDTMNTRDWSPRWLDYFGVRREWLPEVVDGSATIGTLLPAVAKDWGLPEGTPFKIGTADTSSAALAVRLKPGDLLHSVGTTQVLFAITREPKPSPHRLTRLLGVGDEYVYVTHNPVGGSALPWMWELCYRDHTEDDFFTGAVPAAAKKSTGVRLDPPYLGGDRLQVEEQRAAFGGLTLTSTRDDLLAALLKAMRDGHDAAYEALDRQTPPNRVVLTGGAADVVKLLIPSYASAGRGRGRRGGHEGRGAAVGLRPRATSPPNPPLRSGEGGSGTVLFPLSASGRGLGGGVARGREIGNLATAASWTHHRRPRTPCRWGNRA